MRISPKDPPGRANRKALRFSVEIRRLRNAGYTFSAIRMALLEAGVDVSLTTIKREAARPGPSPSVTQQSSTEPMRSSAPAITPGVPMTSAPSGRGASGREIAEAFFNANPSNPLLPTKERS